jgi:hypothetical protein
MSDTIKEAQNEQDIKTRTSVFAMFNSGDDISVSLIQRKCKVGYNSAHRTLMNLVEDGLVKRIKVGSDNTFKLI